MGSRTAPGLVWVCGLLALGLAEPARAQLSGSLTVASDFRLRGISLTERRPAVSAGVAYDDPSGFYAGGSVIVHDPGNAGVQVLGHTEYLGFAVRSHDGGPALDVGVANVDLNLYLDQKYPVEYRQVYVGVSTGAVSARLSYSPDYPREGVANAYLDLNAVVRPAEAWRLSGHLGLTERLGGSRARDGKPERYDLRLGLTRTFERAEIQVAWTAVTPRPRPLRRRTRGGVSVAASVFF